MPAIIQAAEHCSTSLCQFPHSTLPQATKGLGQFWNFLNNIFCGQVLNHSESPGQDTFPRSRDYARPICPQARTSTAFFNKPLGHCHLRCTSSHALTVLSSCLLKCGGWTLTAHPRCARTWPLRLVYGWCACMDAWVASCVSVSVSQ